VCYRVGRLVAGGWVSQDEAQNSLETAARSIGLESSEIPKTIRSGLGSGAESPHPGPSDQELGGSEIPDAVYVCAAIAQHGNAALQYVQAAGLQPADFPVTGGPELVTLAATMPSLPAAAVPPEWAALGPQTSLEETASRVARLVADKPPALPIRYFCEDPSLPVTEVGIDMSAWGPEPEPPELVEPTARLRSLSHPALAEEIIKRIADRTGQEPVFTEGRLWAYNGNLGIWEPYERLDSVAQSLDDMPYGTRPSNGMPLGNLTLRRVDIDGAIRCLQNICREDQFFTNAVPGISFRNCFVQVSADGFRLLRNGPMNRARFSYDFDFSEHGSCPQFGTVLGQLFAPDEDSAARKAALFEFIGASLIGIATVYQKAMVFTGLPGCGKSVVFDILKSIFPPGSVTAVLPEELHMQWEKIRLAGVKLNAVDELNGIMIGAVGTMKAGITGNEIQGRAVGEQGYSFKPVAGWLLSFNAPPRFRDISGGLEDRLTVVQFQRRMRDTPGDNKNLARDVISAELSGIVTVALQGAVRLLRQGRYTVVPSSRAALLSWSEHNNPAILFARDKLEKIDGLGMKMCEVYKTYKVWADSHGYKTLLTSHSLSTALVQAGFTTYEAWISARLRT